MTIDLTHRQLFDFLGAIMNDMDLSGADLRTAYRILGHMNREKGMCFVSDDMLAEGAGVNKKTAQKSVKKLLNRGWFKATRGHGRGISTIYTPALKKTATLSPFTRKKRGSNGSRKGGQTVPEKGVISPPLPQSTNVDKEPQSEPQQIAFDDFWNQYPRKVGKGNALTAYKRAVKKTDHATLLAGVMRYAAERDGEELKFTKHPSTWLNGECWLDEPAPSNGDTNERHRDDQTGKLARNRMSSHETLFAAAARAIDQ